MLKKIIEKSKWLSLELLGAVIYGALLYFLFTWLAGFSLLYAYFGNLALMIIFIAAEEWGMRYFVSENYLKRMSEKFGREKAYHLLQKSNENGISTKAMLYLFYVFILIFTKVIESNPTLLDENLSAFIFSNSYSILLLIALDRLIGQLLKDKETTKEVSEKLKRYFTEESDIEPSSEPSSEPS